jgi:hypothetical protein
MVALNGMPIQMFTRTTATRARDVLVNHPGMLSTRCRARRPRLSAPLSWSRIHFHTAPVTMSGMSHGRSISDRNAPEPGNRRRKNNAISRPAANCPAIEPTVKSTVFATALLKIEDDTTAW